MGLLLPHQTGDYVSVSGLFVLSTLSTAQSSVALWNDGVAHDLGRVAHWGKLVLVTGGQRATCGVAPWGTRLCAIRAFTRTVN